MYALLLVCVLGAGADNPPNTAKGRREWLISHMIVDMQQQGIYDTDKVKKMINKQSPDQIKQLVQYYQQKKQEMAAEQKLLENIAQSQQQANQEAAQLNLRKLEAYRDHLKREFDMKMLTFQQERDMTNYGSQMAQQMFWSQANQILWPNYNGWGYGGGVRVYGGHRGHHYHRR